MIHTYSDLFIWPIKEAQSSCSDTTAELLIKQRITHSEHCKPQLIRFGPLYYTTLTSTAVGWILTLSSSFLCFWVCVLDHFRLHIDMFPVPQVKGRRLRLREERERMGGKEEWPSHMSYAERGGKTRRKERGLDSCCLATATSTGRGDKSLQPLPAAWRHHHPKQPPLLGSPPSQSDEGLKEDHCLYVLFSHSYILSDSHMMSHTDKHRGSWWCFAQGCTVNEGRESFTHSEFSP